MAAPDDPLCAGCHQRLVSGAQNWCRSACVCLGAVWCLPCWNTHIDRKLALMGSLEGAQDEWWIRAAKRLYVAALAHGRPDLGARYALAIQDGFDVVSPPRVVGRRIQQIRELILADQHDMPGTESRDIFRALLQALESCRVGGT